MSSCGTCKHEPIPEEILRGILCRKKKRPEDNPDGSCKGWQPAGGRSVDIFVGEGYSTTSTYKVPVR